MSATPGNSVNISTTGIVGFTGTAMSGTPVTQYNVIVGGATSSTLANVGPGSSGQLLQSGGNAANPAYSTATYPATAGTSTNILTSDGTNFTSSTSFPGGSVYPYWAKVSSNYFYTPWMYTSTSALTPSVNQTYLIPYFVAKAWTINVMGLVCGTFVSNDTVRLGVYNMNTSTGAATGLLADFGTYSVTGTNYRTLGSLSQVLNPGAYYFAVNFNSVNNTYQTGTGIFAPVILTNTSTGNKGFRYNNAAGTFPTSLSQSDLSGGSSTSVQNPLVLIFQGT